MNIYDFPLCFFFCPLFTRLAVAVFVEVVIVIANVLAAWAMLSAECYAMWWEHSRRIYHFASMCGRCLDLSVFHYLYCVYGFAFPLITNGFTGWTGWNGMRGFVRDKNGTEWWGISNDQFTNQHIKSTNISFLILNSSSNQKISQSIQWNQISKHCPRSSYSHSRYLFPSFFLPTTPTKWIFQMHVITHYYEARCMRAHILNFIP